MVTPDWEGLYIIPILGRYDDHWSKTAGCERDHRAAPQPPVHILLTEPCGALPRKCLFIYAENPRMQDGQKAIQSPLHILCESFSLFESLKGMRLPSA
jgi:hypothetical protein